MTASHVVYEISRFDPSGAEECLVERFSLVTRNGSLIFQGADGSEETCQSSDVEKEVASRPKLHEVYANQVIRITACSEALHRLPLLLRAPGAMGDFDGARWSSGMSREHIEDSRGELREAFRVLYVNDRRWGAFLTDTGCRLLPDDDSAWDFFDNGEIPAMEMWGRITFGESASMTYGLDISMLGLITPGVVITTWQPDQEDHGLTLERRGDSDADTFLNWLLESGGIARYFGGDEAGQILLTQLFVEVSIGGATGDIAGDFLMAGVDYPELMMGAYSSSEWTLDIGMDEAIVNAALDRIVQLGDPLSSVVIAARDPKSSQGKARRAALKALAEAQ